MRLVLSIFLFASLFSSVASADEIVFRGNYWRDRNTRVIQPEADLQKELPTGTMVGAHYLLDTITSASVAAGAVRDQPFTELRNEVGFRLGQRIGPATLVGRYSYSSESDYWAHTAGLSLLVDLFHKNSTLGLSATYGHDDVGLRMDAKTFNPVGGLQTIHFILSWSQVLTTKLLLNVSYELGESGFGSASNGYQNNPYRTVSLGGTPSRETTPFERFRQAFSAGFNWIVPTRAQLVPWISFRPSYRFYFDDWGLRSHAAELRMYFPVGVFEFRLTGRYYHQNSVSFWNDVDGTPSYSGSHGKSCSTCYFTKSSLGFYTSDPKLGIFSSEFLDFRVLIHLTGLRRFNSRLAHYLSASYIELSYGHYFNDRYAHTAFGDADLAGLAFAFPL